MEWTTEEQISHSHFSEVEEKDLVLGMQSPKNRSLLGVNEDFEGEHNDKIHFLFSLIACLCATKKSATINRRPKWRWRGSNPRPNKEPQSFLHV